MKRITIFLFTLLSISAFSQDGYIDIPNGYKLIFRNGTTEAGFIQSDGKLDWVKKFRLRDTGTIDARISASHNINSSLTIHSLTPKSYVDSLLYAILADSAAAIRADFPAASGLVIDTILWTPTFSNTTNFSSATLFKASAIRIGNYVDCEMIVGFDCTSGSTETELEATLPVASNFTAMPTWSFECRGQMQCSGVSNSTRKNGSVIGNPTTDRAKFNFECNSNPGTNDNVFHIWFRYEIK